ncbi:MAG: hypothetical protein ACO3Y3_01595 [Phycisphaerales bacterium]|jgi:hypothetical protein
MKEGAGVTNLEALERFRAALLEFIHDASNALGEADSEVDRVQVWLEREQKIHWQQEHRRRSEEVARAKSALYRKQLTVSSKDRPPSAVDEKKALQRAQARLEEAEQKIRRIKHWSVHLGQEAARYKAATSSLAAVLERELPASAEMLKRAIAAIEQYLHTAAPDLRDLVAGIPAIGGAAPAPTLASMRRSSEAGASSAETGPDDEGPSDPDRPAPKESNP